MLSKINKSNISEFIKNSLMGGTLVILPAAIVLSIFVWLYNFVFNLVHPVTSFFIDKGGIQDFFAFVIVISLILWGCFFVGVLLKTKFGCFFHSFVERKFLNNVLGYKIIKDIIGQFFNKDNNTPLSEVALVNIFNNETRMTAFVTDKTIIDGKSIVYTVFVPTGPNPTSGNIYHLKEKFVEIVDVPVETAMKTIIACGAGSSDIIPK